MMKKIIYTYILVFVHFCIFGQYSGTGPVTLTAPTGVSGVQWYKDGVAIPSATSTSYSASVAGNYYAKFTDLSTNCTDDRTINFVLLSSGSTITLDGGSNNPSGSNYQWKSSGTAISGANSATYTTGVGGLYSLSYNNGTCIVSSDNYYVFILNGPDLVTSIGQPTPAAVAGQTSLIPVTVTNIGNASSSGTITETVKIPSGTAFGTFPVNNNGWTCSTNSLTATCITSNPIAIGASSNFSVPFIPTASQVGTTITIPAATVSGGGEPTANTANNTSNTLSIVPSATSDSDGDGIADINDLDDDNDGVLDTDEMNCEVVYNGTFSGNTDGWTIAGSVALNADNSLFFNPGGTAPNGTASQTVTTIPLQTYTITYAYGLGGALSASALRLDLIDVATNQIVGTQTIFKTSTTPTIESLTFKAVGTSTKILFTDVSTTAAAAVSDIQLDIVSIKYCDSDNDGIANSLDIDSDGDGCSDAFEAGATKSLTPNFTFANSTVGANGLSSLVENNDTQTATTTYVASYSYAVNGTIKSCTDSDGDGVADINDLDDDNDGILDTAEAGANPLNYTNGSVTGSATGWTLTGTGAGYLAYNGGGIASAAQCVSGTSSFSQTLSCISPIINSLTFKFGWNNGIPVSGTCTGDVSTSKNVSIKIGGITYATIRTPSDGGANQDNATDQGGDALVTATNGATITGGSPLAVNHSPFSSWNLSTVTLNLPAGVPNGSLEVVISNYGADDIFFDDFALNGICGADTDGDGIPNTLDLDSDGDGCPDAIEGGASFTLANITNTGALPLPVLATGVPSIAGAGQTIGTSQNASLKDVNCAAPDLVTSIGQPTPAAVAGQTSSIPVTVTNIGTASSSGTITETVKIPSGTTFGTFPVNNNGWVCTTNSLTATCTNSNPVAIGASSNFSVPFIPTTSQVGTTITIPPAIVSGGGEPIANTGNNNSNTISIVPSLNSDSDGDGIADVNDLDDDNDGILDTAENPSCEKIVNGSGANGYTGWSHSGNVFPNSVPQFSFNYGETSSTGILSQLISTVPNQSLQLSFSAVGWGENPSGNASVRVDILSDSTTIIATKTVTKTYGMPWTVETLNFTPTTNSVIVKFSDKSTITGSFDMVVTGISVLGACNVDIDGDGIVNSLDLDSDGDGCPDAIEGGATISNSSLKVSSLLGGNSGSGYTGTSTTPVTTNLCILPSCVGTGTTDLGVPTIVGTGQTIGTSQNVTANSCSDNDNDGIADLDDLDDDNDGILDTVEDPNCEKIVNGSGTNGLNNWSASGNVVSNNVQIIFNYAETPSTGVLKQVIATVPNQNLQLKFDVVGFGSNTGGNAQVRADIFQGTSNTVVASKIVSKSYGNPWTTETLNFITTGNQYTIQFTDVSTDGSSFDLVLKSISVLGACGLDTDGDGILNSLDLDSDGDGCPDAIEGGATFTVADLQTGTDYLKGPYSTSNATLGVPTIAGTGQTIGTSQNASVKDANCIVCPTISNSSANNINPSTCSSSTGSIKICGLTISGTGYTVSYSKNNATATVLTNQTADASGCITITGLTAGNYTNIKVISTTCPSGSNVLTTVLSDPAAPLAPTNLTSSVSNICSGTTVNLSATGVSGASYTWSVSPTTGATLNTPSVSGTTASNTFSSSTAGTYTISLTQTVLGCTSPAATTTVTVTATPSVVVPTATSKSNACPATTVNLTSLQPAAVSGVTYEWHTVSSNPSVSSLVATPSAVAAGTYYLYGKSTSGCYGSASSAVTATVTTCCPTVSNIPTNNINPSTCGSSTGSIKICGLLSNGTGYTVSYSKNSAPATVLTNQTADASGCITIANLSAGVYSGISVSNTSCPSGSPAISVTLSDPTPPTLTSTNFTKTNPTACATGNGSIKICGLTSSTLYSIAYNKNGIVQSALNATSDALGCVSLSNLSAGTYDNFVVSNTVTTCASNVTGVSLSLSDPPSATIILGSSQNPSSCGQNDGFIQISGLTIGTQYTLNYTQNSVAQTPITFTASATSYTLSGLTAGSYIITVSNTGCVSNSLSKSLSDPITASVSLGAKVDPSACGAGDGSFTVSGLATGTTYTLLYTKDGVPQTPIVFIATSASYLVGGLTKGTYTNIRVNSAGCVSNSLSATLTDPSAPMLISGVFTNPSACGVLDGSISFGGLSVGTTYLIKYKKNGVWQLPITYAATSTSYTINGLGAGLYTNISVSTSGGCVSNSLTQSLADPGAAVIALGVVTQPTSCGATNGSFVITGLTAGVNYTLNYLRDGVAQTATNFVATGTSYTLSGLTSGNYTGINITQGSCVSTSLVATLSNPGGALIDVIANDVKTCSSANEGSLLITGLSQGLSYTLNYSKNGIAQTPVSFNATSTSYRLNGLTQGAYTNITVTQGGCISNSLSETINGAVLPVAPVLSKTSISNVCPLSTVDLTAISTNNALAGYTLTWHTATPATSINQVLDATSLGTGTYYASFLNGTSGCYGLSSSVNVTTTSCVPCSAVDPGTATASVTSIKTGTTATFSVTGVSAGATTSWSIYPSTGVFPNTGIGTNTGSVSFSLSGHYQVVFTSTNSTQPSGCSEPNSAKASVLFLVEAPINPCAQPSASSVTVSPSSAAIAIGATASFNLFGGTPSSSVQWMISPSSGVSPSSGTGSNTGNISFASKGLYTVVFSIVNNGDGTCSPVQQSSSGTISVGAIPCTPPSDIVISSSVTNQTSNVGKSVTFTATGGSPGVMSWIVSPASGVSPSSGTGTTATVVFTGTGSYSVTFTSKNSSIPSGCNQPVNSSSTVMHKVINEKPIATDDIAVTPYGKDVSGNVLTNDKDPEGGVLTVTTIPVTSPTKGKVVLKADGSYTYTPDVGKSGTDAFCYKVCDIGGLCDTACVTVNILPEVNPNPSANDKPVANDDNTQTTSGIAVIINSKANDIDPDGNSTLGTPTKLTNPSHGTVTQNFDGTFKYTPSVGYVGKDSFTYQICDTGVPSLCDTATVNVKVLATPLAGNQAPVAIDDANLTVMNTPVSGNVNLNDSDPDAGQSLSYTAIGTPVSGLVLNSAGTYTYTPVTGFVGTIVQKYKVCDNGTPVLCDTASLVIAVNPLPVAKLVAKVFLQGALIGTTNGLMRDDLRAANRIPLTEPYTSLGTSSTRFKHIGGGGETTSSLVLSANAGTGDAIVDWVFVELRSKSDSTQITRTVSALVQRDGDIVSSTDGTSSLSFTGLASNSYFISVKHRNHLGVMTNQAIALTSVGTLVDFTTMDSTLIWNRPKGSSNYDGLEMNKTVLLGKNALWAGNCVTDFRLKYDGASTDLGKPLNEILVDFSSLNYNYNNGLGYKLGDVNMDGKVKYSGSNNDIIYIQNNVLRYRLNTSVLYNYNNMLEQLP